MIKCKRLSDTAVIPYKAHVGDAGFDLIASAQAKLPACSRALVSTGIAVEIPEGYYGRIAPRSGLSSKYKIDIGAGVIDASYRGELKVLMINNDTSWYNVFEGDKIAQLIIEKIHPEDTIVEVREFTESDRGSDGFGSTGV